MSIAAMKASLGRALFTRSPQLRSRGATDWSSIRRALGVAEREVRHLARTIEVARECCLVRNGTELAENPLKRRIGKASGQVSD
jgi:hypothetical protein